MQHNKNIRSCPVCKKKVSKLDCQYKEFLYYKCSYCSLLVFANPPTQKYLKVLYSKDYARGDDKEHNALLSVLMHLPMGAKAFDILRYFIYSSRAKSATSAGPHGSVLDIGCGKGEFLKFMKQKDWDISGLEVSKSLVQSATDLSGGRIYNTELANMKIHRKFDSITMWHVFEHLPNPDAVIKQVSKVLKKDGTLIIEVPHSNSLSYKIFKNNWTLLLVPQHLHFWSKDSFNILLSQNNFKTISIEYPIHFPFVFISSLVKFNNLALIVAPILLPFSVVLAIVLSKFEAGEVIRIYAKKI